MSNYTKDSVIKNKKEAIKSLNQLLESYINDSSGNRLKKADLLSYWIKDFVRFIKFEEKFDPKRNIAYKRGNIVKVNFGFNIGSEYGGLHYGVVWDIQNAHTSPVVTIIPLTSIKNTQEVHKNNVSLGNELYRLLKLKYDTINKSLKDEQAEINEVLTVFGVLVDLTDKTLEETKDCEADSEDYIKKLTDAQQYLNASKKAKALWEEKKEKNEADIEYLEKIGSEISKMKEGSIALVNQITTISKIRIYDPRNLKGVLAGISLSEESMEKINEKFKELYVF